MTQSTEPTAPANAERWARLKRLAPSIVVAALFLAGLYALHRLLIDVDLPDVLRQLRAMPGQTVGLAALTTAASYAALIGYDWSALKYINRKVPFPIVGFASFVGYALGNTLGIGALSGGAVRYRIYSKLGLDGGEVAVVSAFCAIGFGLGITAVGAAALVARPDALASVLPVSAQTVRALSASLLVVALALLVYRSRTGGVVRLWRWSFRFPSTGILLGQLGFSTGLLATAFPLRWSGRQSGKRSCESSSRYPMPGWRERMRARRLSPSGASSPTMSAASRKP